MNGQLNIPAPLPAPLPAPPPRSPPRRTHRRHRSDRRRLQRRRKRPAPRARSSSSTWPGRSVWASRSSKVNLFRNTYLEIIQVARSCQRYIEGRGRRRVIVLKYYYQLGHTNYMSVCTLKSDICVTSDQPLTNICVYLLPSSFITYSKGNSWTKPRRSTSPSPPSVTASKP